MTEIVRVVASRSRIPSHAPHLLGPWDSHRMTAVQAMALLMPVGAAIHQFGAALLPGMVLAVALALAWQALFARMRKRAFRPDGALTAVAFALMASPSIPLWQMALALSFGIVMGEQIFGGRGRNFLHPAVVALAFLFFSFPGAIPVPAGTAVALASVLSALVLVGAGLVSWRVLAGIVVGFAGVLATQSLPTAWEQVLTGSLAFGVVFLACDPVSAASTNPGRWLYGLLTGALIVLLGHTGGSPGSPQAVVFAALVGSIFAPLIDQGVIALNIRRRRRRYG